MHTSKIDKLMDCLAEADGEWVPGDRLAERIGSTALSTRISHLRARLRRRGLPYRIETEVVYTAPVQSFYRLVREEGGPSGGNRH